MLKKLIAEGIGTGILSTTVLVSVAGNYPIPTPVLAGFVLSLFVYTIGGLSGCHINPAVTLGLLSVKKIDLQTAIKYIISQLIGAIVSIIIVSSSSLIFAPVGIATFQDYLFELLGMIVFTFSIGSVVFDAKKSSVSGFIIGGALFLGISLSVLGGAGGILNPAVAVALKTFDIGYYLVEIIGSVMGFQLASYVFTSPIHRKRCISK